MIKVILVYTKIMLDIQANLYENTFSYIINGYFIRFIYHSYFNSFLKVFANDRVFPIF